MTAEEERQAYVDLAKVMRQAGLDWVVDQVEDLVRAGRPVEKKARVFRDERGRTATTFARDAYIWPAELSESDFYDS